VFLEFYYLCYLSDSETIQFVVKHAVFLYAPCLLLVGILPFAVNGLVPKFAHNFQLAAIVINSNALFIYS